MKWVFINRVNRVLKTGNEEDDSFSMNMDTEKSVTDFHITSPRGKKDKLVHLDGSEFEKEFWDEPFIVRSDSDRLTSSNRVAPLKIKLDDSLSDMPPSLSQSTSNLSRRSRVPPLEFWKGIYVHLDNSSHVTKERVRRIVDQDEERIEEEFEEENVKIVHSAENVKVGSERVKETRPPEAREISFLSEVTESQRVNQPSEPKSKPFLVQPVAKPSIPKSKGKSVKRESKPKKPVKSKEPLKSREPKSKPKPIASKFKPIEEEDHHPSPPPVVTQNPWTEEELQKLHDAVETIPLPLTSPLFWTQVSLRVSGRTAEECKVVSLDHGFKPPDKKIPEKPKINKKTEKGMKLARKGTMKRKRQLREMMEELDQEEDSKDKETLFDAQQINGEWASAFKVKTPAISRKRGEPLNTSVMVRMNLGNEI